MGGPRKNPVSEIGLCLFYLLTLRYLLDSCLFFFLFFWLLSCCYLNLRFYFNNVNGVADIEMPEHDLEPPRFSRQALEKILENWTAVKAMLLCGRKEHLSR